MVDVVTEAATWRAVFRQLWNTSRVKSYPLLADSDREELCRLMDFQKLSQNERLTIIVQVLFFEQLQLRTSTAGCFFVQTILETGQDSLEAGWVQHHRRAVGTRL